MRQASPAGQAARQQEGLVVATCPQAGEMQGNRGEESIVRERVARCQQVRQRRRQRPDPAVLEVLHHPGQDVSSGVGHVRAEGARRAECGRTGATDAARSGGGGGVATARAADGQGNGDGLQASGAERGGAAGGQRGPTGRAGAREQQIEGGMERGAHGPSFPGRDWEPAAYAEASQPVRVADGLYNPGRSFYAAARWQ